MLKRCHEKSFPKTCRTHRMALMKTEYYWIGGPWKGRLAIVPRPRGGDWLEDEIRSWHEAGFDIIVSLLTPPEIEEFDLDLEQELSRGQNIEFISFPIPDREVPTSREAVIDLAHKLDTALSSGMSVGLHCRQGIGRSSLIAASVLIASGENSAEAFERISEARGRPVPDTVEQKEWVKTLATRLSGVLPTAR
jgi:protein-tyrosine phosphatase